MRTAAPTAWYHGPLGRGLVVVWALALALVAVPCAAMADAGGGCGHCAVDASHAADGSGHVDCFQCDAEAVATPAKADDRGPGTAGVANAPVAPVLIAARPAVATLTAELPRPPDVRLYLKTGRLRI